MSRSKARPKRGRRQTAMLAAAWFTVLFTANLVFNIIPMFPFQAIRDMETRLEISRTKVIWEETAYDGKWDGIYHFLVANEDVAVFGSNQFYGPLGWYYIDSYLMDCDTKAPIAAQWTRQWSADTDVLYLMGYVKSEEVELVEYEIHWYDGTGKVIEIQPESYIYKDGATYYVQDGGDYFLGDPIGGEIVYMESMDVRARDEEGNVIYQERLLGN